MWPLCPSANILWLLLPLLLGVLTGFLAWRGRGSIFTAARVPVRRAPAAKQEDGPPSTNGPSAADDVPIAPPPPDISPDPAIATFAETADELPPADIPLTQETNSDPEPGPEPEPEPEPQPEPQPEPEARQPAAAPVTPAVIPTDLTMIRGIGPALASTLHLLGVTRLEQIAAWSPEESARIDQKLGSFGGRMQREKWIEQARLLTSGDHAGFVTRFGVR